MYKTLCVVLLLPTFALTQDRKPASASPVTPISPAIVAHGKLVNQSAPIPTTTILTPAQNGLYRLSAYATITTPASNYGGFWEYNFMWTDDSGIAATGGNSVLYAGSGNTSAGPFVWNGVAAFGPTIIFEAKAGTPIAYSVTLAGTPDDSVYALYYTLERLE